MTELFTPARAHLNTLLLRRLAPFALTALTLAACTDEATERLDFEAEQAAAERVRSAIDNGDGTWSYALAEDFDPQQRVKGKIITWRYDGQATFSSSPTFGGERTFVVPEPEPLDPLDQLMKMRRVDRDGRVWVVDSVDHEAWRNALATHPDEDEGDDADLLPLRSVPMEAPFEPGELVRWTPASWTHSDCVPGGGLLTPNELHLWEGESRNEIHSGHTARQQTAVRVRVNGSNVCSAVILRQDQVLTAAHCVSDDSNNPIDVNTVDVCRDDISGCIDADDIDFSSSYGGGSGSGGGTDFSDDWAIIELEETWSEAGYGTAEDMDLSSASDTTLGNLSKVHNLAFPGYLPGCTLSSGSTLIHNAEDEPIATITSKRLKLKLDGSAGHSGSPIYYCPEGDNDVCGGGELGFVIGVFAGWNSGTKRHVGPKASSFRSAAIAFMDD